MISKCANPDCSVHFLYLHEGKLFRVLRETDGPPDLQMGVDPTVRKRAQRVEFYWLCPECAHRMTVRYEKGSGVVLKPLGTAFGAAS
jgi:hypothetical protein